MSRLPLLKSPLGRETTRRGQQVDDATGLNTHDETLFADPHFEHYEATSNIQLFFDLFFVANLTSFTSVHEINSRDTLESYVAFISILWFTWCQVTLYDVRFATDSIFERVAHACHFGVMVGFAVVGPNFLVDGGWGPLRGLSILLTASRLVLFAQYGTTLLLTWRYKNARVPLIIVMVSLLVSAAIYLGVSFAFHHHVHWSSYTSWYIIAVSEAVINIVVAQVWPALSLWKTHLVERMTCLTLIILGEGIIGLTKTITKIEKVDQKFTSADIGILISAVLIIYLFYRIYFDNINLEVLGPRRQHVWTVLHFPFHLALCLVMEGINQVLLWFHIVRDIKDIFYPLLDAITDTTSSVEDLKTLLDSVVEDVLGRFETTDAAYDEVMKSLNEANSLGPNTNEAEFLGASLTGIRELAKIVLESFGWEIPEAIEGEGISGFQNTFSAVLDVFNLTFGYFTVCAGLVLILIGVFSILCNHDKAELRLRHLRTMANFLVGLGIILLSTMTITDAAEDLGESPWLLPAVMLILFLLLVVNHLPRGYYKSKLHEGTK